MAIRLPKPPNTPDTLEGPQAEILRLWERWGNDMLRSLTVALNELNTQNLLTPYASTALPPAVAPFRLAMLAGSPGTGTAALQPIFNDGTRWRRAADLTQV